MSVYLRLLLEAAGPTANWIAALVAGVVSAFVIYIGMALGVALFNRDDKVRRQAASLVRVLLSVFTRRNTR